MMMVAPEIVTNGKVTRPAEYEMDVVQKIRVNAVMVDQRIVQLTAELAKWTDLKAQIGSAAVAAVPAMGVKKP